MTVQKNRSFPILKTVACLAFVVASFDSFATAENWAHWRGPTGNGTAPKATPPLEWSPTKNVKWKVEVPGRGLSSPIVWENQVFLTTAVPAEGQQASGLPTLEFKLLCFDRHDGKVLWERTATVTQPHQRTHETNGFASASPCTDGQHVYAHFGSRGLYCYSMTGELSWKRDDFGKMQTLNGFGEGSSPTLEGDKILVPWDHRGPSALYALDKRTGHTIWKAKRDEPTEWATPLVVEYAGRKQIVMNGQNLARSYDLESGKEVWRCGGQTARPIASPVAANGLVFVCSGFQGSFLGAFRLDGEGDIQGTNKVVWTMDHDTPDVASPLLSEGRLYFHKAKTGLLSCVDAATGKPHYLARRIGLSNTYASPIAAGGYVYLTARSGNTVVIKDADALSIVATNTVEETVGATPAPVDNELFIRGDAHLFCIAGSR
jgi:outer membrane protein assembly factor BamB